MARRVISRSKFIAPGPTRDTIWFASPLVTVTAAASATAVLMSSLNAAALALRPFTVIRTRLRWRCQSDQSGATETFIGNIGFAVVSEQASTLGITALPTPATNLDSDLFYVIDQWIGRFQLIGTDVASNTVDRPLESKAMRKVNADEDIVQVMEAGIGGSGVTVSSVGRFLVKLH